MTDNWQSLINRIKLEADETLVNSEQKGCAIITVHMLVNAKGMPLVWVINEGKRIEPSNAALSIIKQLSES